MTVSQQHDTITARIRDTLKTLYPDAYAEIDHQLTKLIHPAAPAAKTLSLSERDVMLIAYGDHVFRADEKPLKTLDDVLAQLALPLTSVHLLPFYPYSSDDGFSVIDYYQIDPALGTWEDVRRLSTRYRLMFDAVFNHISAHSEWFQAFLRGEKPYTDYFVTLDANADVSKVVRPRTHPLLTPFETANGRQYIWTTFSDDQIDLNIMNPDVLIELVKALLFYVEQGAQYIRLDAIAFLWKEVGTTSLHLPETHAVIQLMRDVLDLVAPEVILITETNVPHEENLSYFGDGTNEAQLVYQFTLPPLILHTLHIGDARQLTEWAKTIKRISDRTTFFNFTASHDGIGLRPVQGILSEAETDALVQRTLAHGGRVSYRNNSDGTQSPYEMNITYFDAITAPEITNQNPDMAVDRFILSQAIMLAFVGMPGIYLHSLFGSRNDHKGVQATGRARSINREKLNADELLATLADSTSLTHNVFQRYKQLLEIRTSEPAFHPLGEQQVLDVHPQIFALERTSPDGTSRVLALHNISGETVTYTPAAEISGVDLFGEKPIERGSSISLTPYQVCWIKLV
jgi:glucosylglycerate phosphorylase